MDKFLALTLPGGQTIQAPSSIPSGGTDTLNTAIGGAITLMILLAVVLCLFNIVRAGIQWASSSGDKQKVASARGRLTYSIIGLVVVMLAFFIVNVIGGFIGIDLLKK